MQLIFINGSRLSIETSRVIFMRQQTRISASHRVTVINELLRESSTIDADSSEIVSMKDPAASLTNNGIFKNTFDFIRLFHLIDDHLRGQIVFHNYSFPRQTCQSCVVN